MNNGIIFCFHSSSDLYGASRIFLATVRLLNENGYQPIVFLSSEGPLEKAFADTEIEVRIVRLGILRRKYFNMTGLVNRLYYILKAMWVICRATRKLKPRWVYNNTSSSLAPAFAAAIMRVNLVWHIHEIIDSPKVFAKFLAACFQRFAKINVVVSTATFNHWQSLSHGIVPRLRIVHNGLLSGQYTKPAGFIKNAFLRNAGVEDPSSAIVIGMIGRVHYWKGQSYFVEIAGQLAAKYPTAYFLMAGDAFPGYEYLYKEIDDKIKSLGLEKRVLSLGYLSDPLPFFHSIDVFVLPSILPDPLPTVVLEAMACGLPVVATGHGGALDMVVPGENGVLIPWDNATKSAEILEPILESSEVRRQFGARGMERVKGHFSLEAYSQSILSIAREMNNQAEFR